MGIIDFFSDRGREIPSSEETGTAAEKTRADVIRTMLEAVIGDDIQHLSVSVDASDIVHLGGVASDQATYEKAILLSGNVTGIAGVDHSTFAVSDDEEANPPRFYTVRRGDSLSRIAKREYGDAMKWRALFEANREVIEDPDRIYPGQQIRLPEEV